MIVLLENQACPFWKECPYNKTGSCHGAHENRTWEFTCEYVSQSGVFVLDGHERSVLNKTGKMQVIMEGSYGS